MGWKDKVKEWGGGDVSFLSEDGEVITFVIVGDPVLIEGKFKGQSTRRAGIPIITLDGFSLLTIGLRVARRLVKYESQFDSIAFDLVRHGEQGDTDSKYELSICGNQELAEKLLAMQTEGVSPEVIDEAIASAREIASG